MKIWIVLLTALIVVGCAPQSTVIIPEWTDFEREQTDVGAPHKLPELCEIPRDGIWSTNCWAKLDAYDIVATGNTTIAEGNTEALIKTEAAFDHLIEAGKYQQQLTQFREEMLANEKRQRAYDKWFYRAIIGGLIVVGVSR